jgi:hypothetical protein
MICSAKNLVHVRVDSAGGFYEETSKNAILIPSIWACTLGFDLMLAAVIDLRKAGYKLKPDNHWYYPEQVELHE